MKLKKVKILQSMKIHLGNKITIGKKPSENERRRKWSTKGYFKSVVKLYSFSVLLRREKRLLILKWKTEGRKSSWYYFSFAILPICNFLSPLLSYDFSHNIYVGLFLDKKSYNFINLFLCILWDFFVMSLVSSKDMLEKLISLLGSSGVTCKGHIRSTCQKLKTFSWKYCR